MQFVFVGQAGNAIGHVFLSIALSSVIDLPRSAEDVFLMEDDGSITPRAVSVDLDDRTGTSHHSSPYLASRARYGSFPHFTTGAGAGCNWSTGYTTVTDDGVPALVIRAIKEQAARADTFTRIVLFHSTGGGTGAGGGSALLEALAEAFPMVDVATVTIIPSLSEQGKLRSLYNTTLTLATIANIADMSLAISNDELRAEMARYGDIVQETYDGINWLAACKAAHMLLPAIPLWPGVTRARPFIRVDLHLDTPKVAALSPTARNPPPQRPTKARPGPQATWRRAGWVMPNSDSWVAILKSLERKLEARGRPPESDWGNSALCSLSIMGPPPDCGWDANDDNSPTMSPKSPGQIDTDADSLHRLVHRLKERSFCTRIGAHRIGFERSAAVIRVGIHLPTIDMILQQTGSGWKNGRYAHQYPQPVRMAAALRDCHAVRGRFDMRSKWSRKDLDLMTMIAPFIASGSRCSARTRAAFSMTPEALATSRKLLQQIRASEATGEKEETGEGCELGLGADVYRNAFAKVFSLCSLHHATERSRARPLTLIDSTPDPTRPNPISIPASPVVPCELSGSPTDVGTPLGSMTLLLESGVLGRDAWLDMGPEQVPDAWLAKVGVAVLSRTGYADLEMRYLTPNPPNSEAGAGGAKVTRPAGLAYRAAVGHPRESSVDVGSGWVPNVLDVVRGVTGAPAARQWVVLVAGSIDAKER